MNDILSNDIVQLSRNKCPYLVISYLKKHVGPALTKTSNREWVPLYYQQLWWHLWFELVKNLRICQHGDNYVHFPKYWYNLLMLIELLPVCLNCTYIVTLMNYCCSHRHREREREITWTMVTPTDWKSLCRSILEGVVCGVIGRA